MSLIGSYVGNDPDALIAFEQWLGRPVDLVVAHTGRADWGDWLSSISWSLDLWSPLNLPIAWTIPLFADSGNLAAAAAGKYDQYYLQAAQVLANSRPGDDVIYIRIGEEFNGSWMPWAAAGHEQEFVEAFQNFVDVFRSVSDRFKFEWNVNVGDQGMDPATAYPGDKYVDVVGMDFYYNTAWDSPDPVEAWNYMVTGPYGLKWLEDFAAAHNKPTAYPEWGVNSDGAGEYIKAVADWFANHNVVYQSYWDSNDDFAGDLSNGQYPSAAAAYLAAFGGSASLPDIAPPTGLDLAATDDTGWSNIDNVTKYGSDLTITGFGVAGASIKLFDDINNNGVQDAGESTLRSQTLMGSTFSIDISLAAGIHHIRAFQTDAAGDVSKASAALDITVDTSVTAPLIKSEVLAGGTTGKLTLIGSKEVGSKIAVFDGTSQLGIPSSQADGTWTFITSQHPSDKLHVYTAVATDAAGNTAKSSNSAFLGSSKSDTVIGTLGDDLILGGGGADQLKGGSGKDAFLFTSISDSRPGAGKFDTISDFTHGVDKIDFSGIAGVTRDAVVGSPGHVSAHGISYYQSGSDTIVIVNASGLANHVDMEIHLTGVNASTLSYLDFWHS